MAACIIREMRAEDRAGVLALMRAFYASDAVMTAGSEEIFARDIDACLRPSPYVAGYVFAEGGALRGYAMIARSYSVEFGAPCVWVEDLYLLPAARGQGLAGAFFDRLQHENHGVVFRLEVEEENARAIRLYERRGFARLPYRQMIRLRADDGPLAFK